MNRPNWRKINYFLIFLGIVLLIIWYNQIEMHPKPRSESPVIDAVSAIETELKAADGKAAAKAVEATPPPPAH